MKCHILHSLSSTSTPEYFRTGEVTFAADWWGLGILLYELLIGVTPFYSNDPRNYGDELSCKIVMFPTPLKHHILLSDCAKQVIQKLLTKDPKVRLGEELLNHEFFKERDWTQEQLLEKKVDQTYIFLQKSLPAAETILNNNVEEPITQLYPAITIIDFP